uniref:Uncharacterized protein n=1 Tax=Aureoumbra lagunensis TaxID=44058 RepID=A0A7S3K612_9STRA|mmetsp:Transcript_21839/g.33604  ORF Transcript_21839/g.33604 Transcript_21839/m.33604 type:complete len:274 (-) Transcript_21839:91-912(-)
MTADGPNVLGIILEASPQAAVSCMSKDYVHVIEAVTTLASVHMTSYRNGEIVILAALPGKTKVLYLSDKGRTMSDMRSIILERLHNEIILYTNSTRGSRAVCLDMAISRFLLHINNRKRVIELISALSTITGKRVIIFKVTDDVPGQYNATMNSIFAAKQCKIAIDACVLTDKASLFLKQATHLTRGIFVHLPSKVSAPDFHATILTVFSAQARSSLRLPVLDDIDQRPACRCHYPPHLRDHGWVCTRCFSVYCDSQLVCSCQKAGEQVLYSP